MFVLKKEIGGGGKDVSMYSKSFDISKNWVCVLQMYKALNIIQKTTVFWFVSIVEDNHENMHYKCTDVIVPTHLSRLGEPGRSSSLLEHIKLSERICFLSEVISSHQSWGSGALFYIYDQFFSDLVLTSAKSRLRLTCSTSVNPSAACIHTTFLSTESGRSKLKLQFVYRIAWISGDQGRHNVPSWTWNWFAWQHSIVGSAWRV